MFMTFKLQEKQKKQQQINKKNLKQISFERKNFCFLSHRTLKFNARSSAFYCLTRCDDDDDDCFVIVKVWENDVKKSVLNLRLFEVFAA